MVLTLWPKVRATKMDQLPSQWIISRGQELPIVRLVAIHTMEDVGEQVFVLGVASQVTWRETVH